MGEENAHMLRLHLFVVTRWRGKPRNLLPDEHEGLAWFTLEDTTRLTLAHAEYPRLFAQALELGH
jgi:hypothetical protein